MVHFIIPDRTLIHSGERRIDTTKVATDTIDYVAEGRGRKFPKTKAG